MEYRDLPPERARRLADALRKYAKSKARRINSLTNDFTKDYAQYRLHELSESKVFLLQKEESHDDRLCVGFPFPIFSERMPKELCNKNVSRLGISARLHLRGEPLRKEQRAWIKQFLQSISSDFEWHEIENLGEFRRMVRSTLSGHGSWVYVDSYTYIGDGIIGLYFLDSFTAQRKPTNISVVSDAFIHMKKFFDTHEKTQETLSHLCEKPCLIIMPDLIDSHLSRTLSLIESVHGRNVHIFLVGRNILIKIRGGRIVSFHYTAPDPLLRNKNIEDYMEDCLLPFIPARKGNDKLEVALRDRSTPGRKSYFINPFTSTALKDMDASLVFWITRELIRDKNSFVYISKGLKTSKDVRWVESFQSMINKDHRTRAHVHLMSFEDLSDMAEKLEKLHVGAVLTGDTSVSHLANRLGIPNVTVYRPNFWDPESVQSLTSDSPLGFCRYANFQFPALSGEGSGYARIVSESLKEIAENSFPSGHEQRLLQRFHRQVDELVGDRRAIDDVLRNHMKLRDELNRLKCRFEGGRLSWAFSIYDPHEMVKGVLSMPTDRICHLVRAAWKISPAYKLGALR